MTSSDNEEETRINLQGDVEEDDIRYCQEQTVDWVSEMLTLTGGFGEIDPSRVKYGPQIVEIWDDLKVPSRNKLSALNKPRRSLTVLTRKFTNPNTDWHHFPTAEEKLPERERGTQSVYVTLAGDIMSVSFFTAAPLPPLVRKITFIAVYGLMF
eukprot:sb/3473276/